VSYSSFVYISACANVSLKKILRECLRAGLSSGFPSSAPAPVIVPAVLGTHTVWIPNQKKKTPLKEPGTNSSRGVLLHMFLDEGT